MQVCQEIEGSFGGATDNDRLREQDAIAIDGKARLQLRCFDVGLIACRAEKGQSLLVCQLKSRTDNLPHRAKSTKDLRSGILVFEHDCCGAVMGGDLANDGQLMGRMPSQSVGL